jgi:hypothetical protein
MNFSFVIPTGEVNETLLTVLEYIHQSVPSDKYEIIVVGNVTIHHPNVRCIPFDETQKSKAWITRKKNIGTQLAKFENIVYLHDYIVPNPDNWYSGWMTYGNDFEVATNTILTMEGFRHSDWVVCSYDLWEAAPNLKDTYDVLLPYNTRGMNEVMYVSGNYFVAKKEFMLSHPLDENLVWGDAEDIEWSRRVRKSTTFQINTHSSVHIIKPGKWAPALLSPYAYSKLNEKFGVEPYYV